MTHNSTKVSNRTPWTIKHITCSNISCSNNSISNSSNSHHLRYHFSNNSINNPNSLNSLQMEAIKILRTTTLAMEMLWRALKTGFRIMSLVAHRWGRIRILITITPTTWTNNRTNMGSTSVNKSSNNSRWCNNNNSSNNSSNSKTREAGWWCLVWTSSNQIHSSRWCNNRFHNSSRNSHLPYSRTTISKIQTGGGTHNLSHRIHPKKSS